MAKGLPIFFKQAEFDLLKGFGRELIENIVNQFVNLYKPDISNTTANFYGESKHKVFLEPIEITCVVEISDRDIELVGGQRRVSKGDMIMHVYSDHLVELGIDIDIGDYLKHDDKFYEIVDAGYNQDANERKLGGDRDFYRTILATHVHKNIFEAR